MGPCGRVRGVGVEGDLATAAEHTGKEPCIILQQSGTQRKQCHSHKQEWKILTNMLDKEHTMLLSQIVLAT